MRYGNLQPSFRINESLKSHNMVISSSKKKKILYFYYNGVYISEEDWEEFQDISICSLKSFPLEIINKSLKN